jgi:hypothetical protein
VDLKKNVNRDEGRLGDRFQSVEYWFGPLKISKITFKQMDDLNMPSTVEGINWFKECIDFGFAFLATALGVLLAFELDRCRERAGINVKKMKLIQSLVEELDFLTEFIHESPNLQKHINYRLQTDVIEETIKDQLEFFDQKTNKFLKRVRKSLILENEELAEWTELNKSAIGTGKYPSQQAVYNVSNISAGWTTFTVNISSMIVELKKELEREKAES